MKKINLKRKGTNAERELVHMFWNNSWAAIRVAGSGSSQFPSPDVLASNAIRRLAIECKSTKDDTKYISNEGINQLKEFSVKFGAEAWIGVRFDVHKWFFLNLEDLDQKKESYAISLELARQKGLSFDELVGKFS